LRKGHRYDDASEAKEEAVTTKSWTFRLAATAAALFAIATCSQKPETRDTAISADSTRATVDWVVTGHRMPGVSAMSDSEAVKWHGHTIHLAPELAVSGGDTCADPSYVMTDAGADSVLAATYHVSAAELGLDSSSVRIGTVMCDAGAWMTMGGTIIWIADDHGFAPWNGVFFELRPAIP